MYNMRERIATMKQKKKQLAEEATKSLSSKGKASKDTKKVTTDEEGRKLTKCIEHCMMLQARQRKWMMLKKQTVQLSESSH